MYPSVCTISRVDRYDHQSNRGGEQGCRRLHPPVYNIQVGQIINDRRGEQGRRRLHPPVYMAQGGQITRATEKVSWDTVGCTPLCKCMAQGDQITRATEEVCRDAVGCTRLCMSTWARRARSSGRQSVRVSKDAAGCTYLCTWAKVGRQRR